MNKIQQQRAEQRVIGPASETMASSQATSLREAQHEATPAIQRVQGLAANSPYITAQRQLMETIGAASAEQQLPAEDSTSAPSKRAEIGEAEANKGGKQILLQFTGADGHAHTLYLEGEPGQERLMMASSPQQLRQVLMDHWQNWWQYYENNGLLGTLEETIRACDTMIRLVHVHIVNRDQQWRQDKQQAETLLETNVATLSHHLMWGSQAWAVDWIKPSTGNYPPVWAGPKTATPILQSTLAWYRKHRNIDNLWNIRYHLTKNEWDAWVGDKGQADLWDSYFYENSWLAEHMTWPQVYLYGPHNGGPLPEGGATIGLAGANQIYSGMQIAFNGQTGNTPGGGKINTALAEYGFKPDHEGLDGDHARECQLGGQDALNNLWPLERAPNRAGGVWLDSAEVYDAHQHRMPYPVFADLVRLGNIGGVTLRINIVADTASARWGWR